MRVIECFIRFVVHATQGRRKENDLPRRYIEILQCELDGSWNVHQLGRIDTTLAQLLSCPTSSKGLALVRLEQEEGRLPKIAEFLDIELDIPVKIEKAKAGGIFCVDLI